jgi:Fur family ferric uptake transcriptional regulator
MSSSRKTEHFLKEYDLRSTSCRRDVLRLFFSAPFALSQSYLEENLDQHYDRVTIYRTLKSFLDAGFIHKVLDDTGGIKYALCSETCKPEQHHDRHVHFKCRDCGKTICLEEIGIPSIRLPRDYQMEDINVLITGICDECARISGK